MRCLRRTKEYKLVAGSLQARGCYQLTRLSDGATSYWHTGYDGHRWAYWMRSLDNHCFNKECEKETTFSV